MEDFETKLKNHFGQLGLPESTLKKAIAYSLLSPGKRIRPQLVYEVTSHLGLSAHLSDPLAFAVEMVHAFSLIHDDLPCMDDDDFRRGLPTNHKVFGEPVALLAGDALLTHAFGTFGLLSNRVTPEIFSRAFHFFIQTIGAKGIMGGQALELELKQASLERLIQVQALKTTALFQASILIPVILAGYTSEDETFKEYLQFSEAFGFAFQAADDLEDHAQDQGTANGEAKNLLSFMTADELRLKATRQLLDSKVTSQSPLAQWLINKF